MRSCISGNMDESTGMLTPAYNEVCFNASIKTDDGLLAHSVSRREGIAFEQARMLVVSESDAMLDALNSDRELVLGHIGTLSITEDNVLFFKPYEENRVWCKPLVVPQKAVIAKQQQVITRQQNYYTVRIPKCVIRYAAMLTVLLFGYMSLSMPPVSTTGNVDRASVVPLPKVRTNNTDINELASNDVSEKTVAEDATECNKARYFLIVGASASEEKCKIFITQHPDFNLELLPSGKGKTLIYVACSDERSELLDRMRSDKIMNEFGQTWVFDAED